MTSLRNDLVRVERLEDYAHFDEIIDVRSPQEFAEDHIPGAHNAPVLDDAQRAEVGTLYVQGSPFAARKIGAAYVAENIAQHLRTRFQDRPPQWRPLIMCWRGGQRSSAMTLILRRVGWHAQQLVGGYKNYRRQVLDRLHSCPAELNFHVICGATGSGKSRLLHALAAHGEQIIDLEALACHKGSVLGVQPNTAQPSQKWFESTLLNALLACSPQKPVYIEAESRKIGTIQVPETLLQQMHTSQCFSINTAIEARVAYLLDDYAYFLRTPERLSALLQSLRHVHRQSTLAYWQDLIEKREWALLVEELLRTHYDPLYQRSQIKNFRGFQHPKIIAANSIKALLPQILASDG